MTRLRMLWMLAIVVLFVYAVGLVSGTLNEYHSLPIAALDFVALCAVEVVCVQSRRGGSE